MRLDLSLCRRAPSVALVLLLPLVGSCASLIGLEEGEALTGVGGASSGSGSTTGSATGTGAASSSGTDASSTGTDASSSGTDASSSGTGGGGGTGGTGGGAPRLDQLELPDLPFKSIGAADSMAQDVLLLVELGGDEGLVEGPLDCGIAPSATPQAAVVRVRPDGGCNLVARIEANGIRDSRMTSFDRGPAIGLGGIADSDAGGRLNNEPLEIDGNGSAIAAVFPLGAGMPQGHVVAAVGSGAATLSAALPYEGGVVHAGGFQDSSEITCSAATPGVLERPFAFSFSFAVQDCVPPANLLPTGEVLGAAASPGGGLLLHRQVASLNASLFDEGVLGPASAEDLGASPAGVSAIHLHFGDSPGADPAYFLVGAAVVNPTACGVVPGMLAGPLVARLDPANGLACAAAWADEDDTYKGVTLGYDDAGSNVVALDVRDASSSALHLARLVPKPGFPDDKVLDLVEARELCADCQLRGMVRSGGTVWILGTANGRQAIGDLEISDGPFLLRARAEDLFDALEVVE